MSLLNKKIAVKSSFVGGQERLDKLKKSLDHFETMCRNNEYTGAKRRMASFVWCQAKAYEDIIYQTSLMGQRDIGEELQDFLNKHS
jgi:hypothetical protein